MELQRTGNVYGPSCQDTLLGREGWSEGETSAMAAVVV
jgi:hypothetical protein